MPQHYRGAHREANGDHLLVTKIAGEGYRRLDVLDLLIPDGAEPAGAAVATEVERDHPAEPIQPVGYPPDMRSLPVQREAMCQHDSQALVTWQVNCVDRYAIVRYQCFCLGHVLGHASILRDGPSCPADASSLGGRRWGSLVAAALPPGAHRSPASTALLTRCSPRT